MMKMSCAICIPTYNRPDVIREFIETAAERYMQYGFDIYIYDSSEGCQTERIVAGWKKQYKNLYYVRVASTVHSNIKVYNIFQEFGRTEKYEYLWVCSDSIRWTQRVLDAVAEAAQQGYDLIIPNYRDVEKVGDKEYTDRNELFLYCAWHMTLYGAVILRVSTMLQDVDWELLVEKYAVPECINHSHVAFYFEKLSRMQRWKAIHLSFPKSALIASGLKKYSGWQEETLFVWCHCWPEMIMRLPEEYRNKDKVIKKSGVNSGILSYDNLKILREQNILTKESYCLYKYDWHKLTDVPVINIWFLCLISPQNVKYLDKNLRRYHRKERVLKRKIEKFCRRFERIYIYGAGKKACRYTEYINAMGREFEGYLITNPLDNMKVLNEHRVIAYTPDLLKNNETGILLALNEANAREVVTGCLKSVDKKLLFSECAYHKLISRGSRRGGRRWKKFQ